MVLPAIVILLASLLACGAVVAAQVRCLDAARSAARLAARGEGEGLVRGAALAVAPTGARVSVTSGGGAVRVVVGATVRLPLPGSPALEVSASATSANEVTP